MLEMYLEKINALVREFVKSIDEDYDARMGKDFAAVLNKDIVEWSIIYVETGGCSFYENFVSRYPKAKALRLFTLSILHEVGHLETEWEMEDDLEERNTITDDEDYFNLFNEYIATEWAGEWVNDNLEKAIALDEKFYDAIHKMYDAVLD